jgi:hypothetical protein
MNRKLFLCLAILAALAFPALAGEYHSGANLVCADCHTAHFSMQHNWDGSTPVPVVPNGTGPDATMNWLSATGPNAYLLKAPANQLCLMCHDNQTFAPDVYALNTNAASYPQGRAAGGINDPAAGAPYDTWKGHTLGSTATPPGWNPASLGATLPPTWYDPTGGLECISCHAQHGPATAFRNLGSYSLGGFAAQARPTYVISTTDTTTQDVWVNIPTGYVAGTGNPATFGPYYDQSKILFNRNDTTIGTTHSSNRLDVFCATCHGNFHGGTGDANIGGGTVGAAADGFIRHPTSLQVMGQATAGGHSSLTRYVANTAKVPVYSSAQAAGGFTDATPGCVSCHKAHGNQNPFGLFYLNRIPASAIDEQGAWATGEVVNDQNGTRNLCGQCHGQGA